MYYSIKEEDLLELLLLEGKQVCFNAGTFFLVNCIKGSYYYKLLIAS